MNKNLNFLKESVKSLRINSTLNRVEDSFSLRGIVLSIKDSIARVVGLQKAQVGELVEFSLVNAKNRRVFGLVLNLEKSTVKVIILGDSFNIIQGTTCVCTSTVAKIPVGSHLLGNVIDPLGVSLGMQFANDIKFDFVPIEVKAPGIIVRASVCEPLQTGILAIDAMIPIGRGQRELIIGDRQTGKTAIVVDTMMNQNRNITTRTVESIDVICVYVAIGQRKSSISELFHKFENFDTAWFTIFVLAAASDSAALQFLAPYSGCAVAEWFLKKKKHCLICFDDLSKQAVAYRQISLLLGRPPGREAYPGDVFYLHSRLLERAVKLSSSFGGSITALPIIETLAGDVSAYIPTNVISITDGQIFLETELFYKGVRPAINVGLSVSRVGSAAQVPLMKKFAGSLKLTLAQYREAEVFTSFDYELDDITKNILHDGARIVEVLKQEQYAPLSLSAEIVIIYAATKGFFREINLENVSFFKDMLELYSYVYLEDLNNFDTNSKNFEEVETFLDIFISFVFGHTKKLI